MPLKMRRVPQEAFLSTARIFRTIEGPLRYRMPQTAERRALPATSITKPERRKSLPAASATNGKKEKIARTKCHNCQKRGFPPDPKRRPVQKAQPASPGENKKRTTVKIVLFPIWGAMWGSNPRHPEPQSGALPTELIAPCQFGVTKVQRFFGIAREYSKKELSLCDWNKNRIGEYVKRD